MRKKKSLTFVAEVGNNTYAGVFILQCMSGGPKFHNNYFRVKLNILSPHELPIKIMK